jgi:3-dehydroquinate dehydratase-2
MKILIINGPNLNLLGKRETKIYGKESFEAYFERLQKTFTKAELIYYQSNIEGEIINKLHEVGFDKSYEGIVLNAGAYTHTSIAIADAVAAIDVPVVEVHISNVYKRESFRQKSYISARAKGVIVGFGLDGYKLAITNIGKFTVLNAPEKRKIGF